MPLRFAAVPGGLLLFVLTLGCNKSDTAPSPPPAPGVLTVNSVAPPMVWANYSPVSVRVNGAGFLSGASVTIGGLAAPVTQVTATSLVVTAPTRGAGPADVVVTNPGGQSATLPGGLMFGTVTLTANPTVVSPGAPVMVSWLASSQLPAGSDWIGLFAVGVPNDFYSQDMWRYAFNTSGTATFTAPAQPGEYEFRYLPNDDYVDIARTPFSVR